MKAENVPVVHLVNVIRRYDEQEYTTPLLHQRKILNNGIRGSRISLSAGRGARHSKLAAGSQAAPPLAQIGSHGFMLILDEHVCPTQSRVETVGQSKVDDAEASSERNERFRSVLRKRPQAQSRSTSQNECTSVVRELVAQSHKAPSVKAWFARPCVSEPRFRCRS